MDKQERIEILADYLYNEWQKCDVGNKYLIMAERLYDKGYRKESEVRAETLNEVYAALWKIPMRNACTKGRVLNAIEKLGVKDGSSLKEIISLEFKEQSSDLAQYLIGVIENLQQHINYLSSVYGKEITNGKKENSTN